MGYQATAATTTIIGKLTPIGRQLLVTNTNSLITKFSIGDSDSYYDAVSSLSTGQVPASSGDIGPNATDSNSVASNIRLKSMLLVNGTGVLQKAVESQSTTVSSEIVLNGITSVSATVATTATTLTHNKISKNDYATDSLVNLFYTFGLPLTTSQLLNYSNKTFGQGGFVDTAISGLSATTILVIGIDSSKYGEMIDGKTLKISLPTTNGGYDIYSTFQNTGVSAKLQDANYYDTSTSTASIGNNIAFLFADNIMRPNGGDSTLSWSTGYNAVKPFTSGQKRQYNLTTNTNIAQYADTCVGVAYLDKGFIVITNPTIVNAFSTTASTATTVTFNSISTQVFQTITCIANRGEFGTSTNPTFSKGDIPRISELALYDDLGNMIAYAKTDRQLPKTVQQFMALGVKIIL